MGYERSIDLISHDGLSLHIVWSLPIILFLVVNLLGSYDNGFSELFLIYNNKSPPFLKLGLNYFLSPIFLMGHHYMTLKVSPTGSFNLWAHYLSILTVFRLSFLIWIISHIVMYAWPIGFFVARISSWNT